HLPPTPRSTLFPYTTLFRSHVDDAGLVVHVEGLGPRLAAVGGLEQAALLAGPVHAAHRADVDDARVLRVDEDLADRVRLLEAHVDRKSTRLNSSHLGISYAV